MNAATAFADVAPDPEHHARLLLQAATAALFAVLDASGGNVLDNAMAQHPFLADRLADVAEPTPPGLSWQATARWWERAVAGWERSCARPRGLLHADVLPDTRSRIALGIIALPEEDFRFGEVFHALQSPLPEHWVSVQVVAAALDRHGAPPIGAHLDRMRAARLVRCVNPDQPLGGQALRIAPSLWPVVRGKGPGQLPTAIRCRPAGDAERAVGFPPEVVQDLQQAQRLVAAGEVDVVIVRCNAVADGVLAARLLGAGDGTVEAPLAAVAEEPVEALALLTGAQLVVCTDPAPGEVADVTGLTLRCGPVVVVVGPAGGLLTREGTRRMALHVPRPRSEERRRFWVGRVEGDVDALVRTYLLPASHLQHLTEDARQRAAADGRDLPDVEDVRAAARAQRDHILEVRARRLDTEGLGWNQLVVPEAVAGQLHDLARRCRFREELSAGGSAAAASGVRALFTGPSGTGKTLGAQVLAAVLGRDVYRVDLSAVFDKYVGETEKHLHQLLRDAEQLDVVLLIDEGDSLLGSRTDGKSANDRYANLETNFLLQRLEEHAGIVLVTSNAEHRIDRAFARRMDASIAFPLPGPAERLRIWRLHLPRGHEVCDRDLVRVTTTHRFTGGQIRNAALHARLLALDAAARVQAEHVERAIEVELRKAGAMLPAPPGEKRRSAQVLSFLEALR